jgi:two-component system OmpR family sensor kinase
VAIRTKITLAMTVLLLAAVTVIGVVTVRLLSDHLIGQVDDRIHAAVKRGQTEIQDVDPRTGSVSLEFVILLYNTSGALIAYQQSGYIDDPDPLPNLPTAPAAGDYFNVQSSGGDHVFRAVAWQAPDGQTVVIAKRIDDVESTIATLTNTVIFTGALVALVGIAAAWLITRRGLRTVDHMVADAETVAAGNLDHRITAADPRTEVGRLSVALNRMVGRLTAAIAERDRQHERLRQFVADAGHELRTPLTAIGGYVQLYQGGAAAEGEKLDRAMDRIGSENARLARLVDDLMALARLDEESDGRREIVDLTALARDAVDDAAVADADHPVELRAAEPVALVGDEGRLRQVLVNLLSNARVHTPLGTPITVEVAGDGEWALLTVADEGPGIPEEHRQRVFDRFYRADRSRSRATGGSGLGLSIVSSIVAAHGGRIDLRSEVGRGTTIEVRLPKARFANR